MSTAVMEQPQATAYQMPPVHLGQLVMVHPGGNLDRSRGSCAIVHSATPIQNPRQLVVQAFSQGETPSEGMILVEHVLHVTDPRAKDEWVKREGALWDYTPWDKALRAELDEIKATVSALVKDLGGPSTKNKKFE